MVNVPKQALTGGQFGHQHLKGRFSKSRDPSSQCISSLIKPKYIQMLSTGAREVFRQETRALKYRFILVLSLKISA